MEQKPVTHWDILKEMDPEMSEAVTAWRNRVTENDAIPPKYQELTKLSIACVIRFQQAIVTHAKSAIKHGASKAEVFHALELAMMLGGIPAYREGAMLLNDILLKEN